MRAPLVLLVLLLAGCVAEKPDASGPSPTVADCDDCGGCGAADLCAAPPPTPVVEPLVYDGRTPGYACLRALQCADLQEGEFLGPAFGSATPLRLVGNVTWSAASEATASFVVELVVDMGNGWEWDPEREPESSGASPVAVDWDLAPYPPGTRFSVYVETGTGTEAGWVAPAQDYRFDGVFLGEAG